MWKDPTDPWMKLDRISAFNEESEPWRISRLECLLSLAGNAQSTDECRTQLGKAIIRIRDEEGQLRILWNYHYFDLKFTDIMSDTWLLLGEFPAIVHQLSI